MSEEPFETFIQRERDRLNAQRELLHTQQREIATQLAALDREFNAIEAYEAAKSGKTPRQTRTRGSSGGRCPAWTRRAR